MKKPIKLLSLLLLIAVILSGCSDDSISNEKIIIHQYKQLNINKEKMIKESEYEKVIWEALVSQTTLKKIVEDDLEAKKENLATEYGALSYYKGLTAEEYILQKTGMSMDELARWQLTKKYAIELIVEKEKLNIDSDEYKKLLEKEAGDMDVKEYEALYNEGELMEKFLEERVLNFLIKYVEEIERGGGHNESSSIQERELCFS